MKNMLVLDGMAYFDTFSEGFLYAMKIMADNIIFDDNFNQDIEYVPKDVVLEYLDRAEKFHVMLEGGSYGKET